MTRPAPWRRTTAAERRRARAEFQAIKARVDASPEMAVYRAENRRKAAAQRARVKLRRMAAGDPRVRRLTEAEKAAIGPDLIAKTSGTSPVNLYHTD